ncbi:MAG: hypothetical protein JSW39_14165 [Desulfobacterales bacterium]|nr:MAG: hypothetical protein JSW39_14165 [Desulfobacterales bacterium]
MKGFLVLSISRNKSKTVVKILDFYFRNPADCKIAGFLALRYAHDFLADRIEFPVALEFFFKSHPLLSWLIKKQERLYLFHPHCQDSPLARSVGDIDFNYCDADTAFT